MEIERVPLLETAEGAQQAGDQPEQGGDAPHVIGREEALEAAGIERPLERATAEKHARRAKGERQVMERGDDRRRGAHARPEASGGGPSRSRGQPASVKTAVTRSPSAARAPGSVSWPSLKW